MSIYIPSQHLTVLEIYGQNTLKVTLQLFFDCRYWFSHKKSLRAFREFTNKLLIVDDTPDIIHGDSDKFYLPISRWYGDKDDNKLLKLLDDIKSRWMEV